MLFISSSCFGQPHNLCVYIHLKTFHHSSDSVRKPYCWILNITNCSGLWHCKHIDNSVYQNDKHQTVWMQMANKQSENLVSVSFLRQWCDGNENRVVDHFQMEAMTWQCWSAWAWPMWGSNCDFEQVFHGEVILPGYRSTPCLIKRWKTAMCLLLIPL